MSSYDKNNSKEYEKILAEFQKLRNEQRTLIGNLNKLEMDLKEHKTVMETLKKVDQDRKCFRLIGGVLCERTVKEVLPQLMENKNFLEKHITLVTEDLAKKGQQMNKYKDEHNIKIKVNQMGMESQKTSQEKSENRNILVSS